MAGRPEKFTALRLHLQEKATEFHDSGDSVYKMTFKAIEALGVRLPPSAYNYKSWWFHNSDNYDHNNKSTRPWSRAKFKPKQVDLQQQTVTFRYGGEFAKDVNDRFKAEEITKARADLEMAQAAPPGSFERRGVKHLEQKLRDLTASAGFADGSRAYVSPNSNELQNAASRCRHPIYGALKGHIRLVAGTDLTKPADPEWGERVWGGANEDEQ